MNNLPAEIQQEQTLTQQQQALRWWTQVSPGEQGETVKGGVGGLDGLRLDARGKYEKWCLNCKSWVSLGSSKGSEYAFREHFLSKPCPEQGREVPENCSAAAGRRSTTRRQ